MEHRFSCSGAVMYRLVEGVQVGRGEKFSSQKRGIFAAAVAVTQHKVAIPQLLSTKKTSHQSNGPINAGRDVLCDV